MNGLPTYYTVIQGDMQTMQEIYYLFIKATWTVLNEHQVLF